MRIPAQQERGVEAVVGVAAIAALVAVPTGLPLSEVVVDLVPALPASSAAPVLIGTLWAGLCAWFWAGIAAHLERLRRDGAP